MKPALGSVVGESESESELEVIGERGGVVLVYDPRVWTESTPDSEKYRTLQIGARFDLARRVVLVAGAMVEPEPEPEPNADGR